jgi:hypothetical protein
MVMGAPHFILNCCCNFLQSIFTFHFWLCEEKIANLELQMLCFTTLPFLTPDFAKMGLETLSLCKTCPHMCFPSFLIKMGV